MRDRFLTADVFTDRPFGGNPLAVRHHLGRREASGDKQGGEIAAIRVGGSSVLMSEGMMEIP
ncbi:MAG TPA: hypothetical protein VGR07_15205 [Thermoanaerobaculia bacterium]|jgi:predicted PhzF superfamily epimerase YddE/YHI9|nr:hypothetical protein [Thermoanaerobaculia bacterium]